MNKTFEKVLLSKAAPLKLSKSQFVKNHMCLVNIYNKADSLLDLLIVLIENCSNDDGRS